MSAAAERARRRADAAQRPAAAPDASVWVGASAGTGKTKVLTDRVLSLMLHGTPPARILCLTFTKAAAAEMANRLSGRLALWATAEDSDLAEQLAALTGTAPDAARMDRARTLFARVLDAPGGMKIQTIHAFCQSLLGRFPLEAGIAPHFRVLDEAAATGMLREARLEVLAAARVGARDDPLTTALAEVSTHALEDAFMKLMASLAAERARLAHALARHGGIDGVERAVFRLLDVAPDDTPEATMRRACADQAFDAPGLSAAATALAEGGKTDLEKAAALGEWLDADTAARIARFGAYRSVFLTGEGERRKRLMTKAVCAASPAGLAAMEAEAARLLAIDRRINALVVARATAGLLRLGAAILAAYTRAKKARAMLDYDDLILGARDLLAREGAASWVLFKLDGGLDHVLIDEAQDTNPEQWQVIDMLSAEFFAGAGAHEAPRTVFAVGDAKQSIYSFQRADPSAFARMRDHFADRARAAEQTWSNVELDYSFRSNAAILRAVDAVFAREPASDGVLFGADALSHRPVRMGQAGLVELWPPATPGPDDEPAPWDSPVKRHKATPGHTRLALAIAHRICRWTQDSDPATAPGPGDEAWLNSRNRRLRPGDVLVLVRRRNAFVAELVRDLKRLGVPVSGVDRMILCDQIAVMDLIALGRVLLLPEDDLTLATVLKGPFLGLDEDTLFALAHGRSGTLWQSLAAHAKRLPAARDAYERLTALMARADFVPPYELYCEILNGEWRGARGRQLLLARLGADANDPIEEFLSLALAHGRENVPSLEGFLHWIEIGAQEVKRDMEIGADAVRVMTVHGAKGLQAPVVILPDTMQVPKPKDGLFWLDEDDESGAPALWPVRTAYDGEVAMRARARAATAQAREHRRLLYVAMTRAEDRLYVCGWAGRNEAPAECWYRLVEHALRAEPAVEAVEFALGGESQDGWSGPGLRLRVAQTATPDREGDAHAQPPGAPSELPDWARAPAPTEPTPPRPLAPSRPAEAEPPVQSPLGPGAERRFQRGRLIHRLLQDLPDLPPARRDAAARRYLAGPAHELDGAEQAEIAAAVRAVLDDARFAPLFGPDSRAEVPLAGTIETARGTEVVFGQVDRLLVSDDAILIVDYKTNRPAPKTPELVPPLYIRQMATYRAVLRRIYPNRRIACALLWTDGPSLMQLSDAMLTAHAP